MLMGGLDAASAAFEVGYESPSRFNREYCRLFGQPPMRNIRALRSSNASAVELVSIVEAMSDGFQQGLESLSQSQRSILQQNESQVSVKFGPTHFDSTLALGGLSRFLH